MIIKQHTKINFHLLFFIVAGLTYGFLISSIAVVLLPIKTKFNISDELLSLIGGLVFGGAFFSKLASPLFNDRYGRRNTLLVFSLILLVLNILVIFSINKWCFVFYRFLCGICYGVLLNTTSIFLVEYDAKKRSILAAIFQLNFTIGLFLTHFLSIWVNNYKLLFGFLVVLNATLVVILLSLDENPSWLEFKKLNRDYKFIDFQAIKQNKKIIFIAASILLLHQFTGINALIETLPVLLHNHSLLSISLYSNLLATGLNIIGTTLGLFFLKRIKTKPILIGCLCALSILASLLACNLTYNYIQNLNIILFGLYFLFYAIGPGIFIWLIISEYFPLEYRGRFSALTSSVHALSGFIVSSTSIVFQKHFGFGKLFVVYAISDAIYCWVVFYYLPNDSIYKN